MQIHEYCNAVHTDNCNLINKQEIALKSNPVEIGKKALKILEQA
jgi:hypothetical protein